MPHFSIRHCPGGVLVSLKDVIANLGLSGWPSWRLFWIRFGPGTNPQGVTVFGMSLVECEDRTELSPIDVSWGGLSQFLMSDIQIVDGDVMATNPCDNSTVVRLECCDASYWDVFTDAPDVIERLVCLVKSGWVSEA